MTVVTLSKGDSNGVSEDNTGSPSGRFVSQHTGTHYCQTKQTPVDIKIYVERETLQYKMTPHMYKPTGMYQMYLLPRISHTKSFYKYSILV
jgi:hypothetical protein